MQFWCFAFDIEHQSLRIEQGIGSRLGMGTSEVFLSVSGIHLKHRLSPIAPKSMISGSDRG
jgi:hypothetical protein